jgi:hypothetical protein
VRSASSLSEGLTVRLLGHADQRLLSYCDERSRQALNGEHLELADGEGSSGLEDCASRLEVIADGRCHEVDFVLHGEHDGVRGVQRERGVPACAVGDGADGSGVDVVVLLVTSGRLGCTICTRPGSMSPRRALRWSIRPWRSKLALMRACISGAAVSGCSSCSITRRLLRLLLPGSIGHSSHLLLGDQLLDQEHDADHDHGGAGGASQRTGCRRSCAQHPTGRCQISCVSKWVPIERTTLL